MKEITIGSKCSKEIVVGEQDLACVVGSGSVHVYATPMMIALMENAASTCLSEFLEDGECSVGVMMNTTHDAATPQGMRVSVCAEIVAVERKKVSFKIIASDEVDQIAIASHDRFVVMKEKFEARASSKLSK